MDDGTDSLLTDLAEQGVRLRRRLRGLNGFEAAATLGGLLTEPRLQGQVLRLELLVHFAAAEAVGTRRISYSALKDAFASSGELAGVFEDPPESPFVELIRTPRGGFRILPGINEASGFWLQRVMNVVETTPNLPAYNAIRDSLHALLVLSEAVCDRAGLRRYHPGAETSVADLPHDLALAGPVLRDRMAFTLEELEALDLTLDSLAPFILAPEDRARVLDGDFGGTELERRPLALENGRLWMLLPTAVSTAIRRAVVETIGSGDLREPFGRALAAEYADMFQALRLLGGRRLDGLRLVKTKGGRIGSASVDVDRGRYVQFVFVCDDLTDFENTALARPGGNPMAAAEPIDDMIRQGVETVSARPDFVAGLILVVGCGVGRPTMMGFGGPDDSRFRTRSLSAADLETMNWMRGFNLLSLFRLLDAEEALKRAGARLFNVNGLLNLLGWMREHEGHLAPHGEIEDDMVGEDGPLILMVHLNAQKVLRTEALNAWDPHVEVDTEGRAWPVRREGLALHAEDRDQPTYMVEAAPPRSVCVTPTRSWWASSDAEDQPDAQMAHQRFRVVHLWLSRAAPVLDDAFPTLPPGPIEWRADFEAELVQGSQPRPVIDFAEACAAITASADPAGPRVLTRASARWEDAHPQVENVAERALVDSLVRATAALAGETLSEPRRADIVQRIVPDGAMRQQHAFRSPTFRDMVRRGLKDPVAVIELEDDATSRLGLGWRARDRSEGSTLRGKPECCDFLNRLVTALETELLEALASFNRRSMLTGLLRNHEGAARETAQWRRTASAVLALHEDKATTTTEILEREAKLNAVALTSRILMEFAMCACPVDGGRAPGDLDLSRLMSLAALIFHSGGDSDAIRWDVMEPFIRITPLGDVHANRAFSETVIEAFAKQTAGIRLQEAIEAYPDYVRDATSPAPEPDDDDLEAQPNAASEQEETEFEAAIVEAFGADLGHLNALLGHLETLGYEADSAVLSLPMSRLTAVDDPKVDPRNIEALVAGMTFEPRANWRDIPDGYEPRDIQPWRFRRRLTVLRKPFLRIGDGPDPELIVAPAMVREAIRYMLNNYRRGDFHDSQLGPGMRRWKARIADRRGARFTAVVAEALSEQGWTVETEVKMTKLLKRSLDRNYGDIDVLAWDHRTGRVLIVECKDVQYRKTFGEVGEQLADFRGETRANGKGDYLRLHLDRVEVARQAIDEVADSLKLPNPRIESHLVFRNPVPMAFALDHMRALVTLWTLDEVKILTPDE